MDIPNFKTRALSIAKEAQELADVIDSQEYLNHINNLIDSLKILIEFINDDSNINTLKNYIHKMDIDMEVCPLDDLCKNVIEQFKVIDNLLKSEIFDFFRPTDKQVVMRRSYAISTQEIFTLTNMLNDKKFINLLASYKVLKHLEGHSKTLIILGPNGSGKTSFANYMRSLDTHVKVIPASKPIIATGHIPNLYNYSLAGYNNELYSGNMLSQDLLQKLIIGICSEHDDIAREYMRTNHREKDSTYEKVKKIFNEFFDVELDSTGFSRKEMKAKKKDSSAFGFNFMSDGERVAFFYIATVIAAPERSFIIVDEPENHLNPAIYNKIWDKLVETRNDCQFIFISHTMDFVSARTNYEIVKIKDFTYPDNFKFEFMGDSLEKIKSDLVVEIVGSRKPIIFCEGSKADYDYKIYESIFGEKYTVVPAGNCTSVERSVEACNLHANRYTIQPAIGIIDSDLKSDEEKERLKNKNIYALKCNEIEMLLIDEAIFKKALKRVFKERELFENFKDDFFSAILKRKDCIIRRLVKTQIDEKLKKIVVDDRSNKTKNEIKKNLDDIFRGIEVDAIWQECESKITEILSAKNYEEALRYCCLEHGEIVDGLGNKFVPDYASIAIGVLRTDRELVDVIRKKYFEEISM